ncbi:hypothetical protein [Arcanobacterium phocae]|uniref:hypothetical protein n=1 Tax=Arcanobacterium phocae TaxID=131112 RepID=UPI001C0EE856|nr:hypothetical protein [Arcanobacterium phocae]
MTSSTGCIYSDGAFVKSRGIGAFLLEAIKHCESTNHSLCCENAPCSDISRCVIGGSGREFDARAEELSYEHMLPDHLWSTTALLKFVVSSLKESPHNGGLYRGVAITLALARLGERGIKPDWLVRVCIAPQLLRSMLMRVVEEWRLSSEGYQNSSSEVFSSWVSMIQEDIALLEVDPSNLAGVLAAALQGGDVSKGRGMDSERFNGPYYRLEN